MENPIDQNQDKMEPMSEISFISVFEETVKILDNDMLISLLNIYFQTVTNKLDIILIPCDNTNYKFFFLSVSIIYNIKEKLNELMTDFINEISITLNYYKNWNVSNLFFVYKDD